MSINPVNTKSRSATARLVLGTCPNCCACPVSTLQVCCSVLQCVPVQMLINGANRWALTELAHSQQWQGQAPHPWRPLVNPMHASFIASCMRVLYIPNTLLLGPAHPLPSIPSPLRTHSSTRPASTRTCHATVWLRLLDSPRRVTHLSPSSSAASCPARQPLRPSSSSWRLRFLPMNTTCKTPQSQDTIARHPEQM